MKFLIVFASFFFAANAGLDKSFVNDFITQVKTIGKECVAEVSASQDDIDSLLRTELPSSHEGKCLLFCFHKRFNIQNDDGSINKEGALKAIEPLKSQDQEIYDKVYSVFKTCESTPPESDPCEYSAHLAECAVKEGKAIGLHDLILLEIE